MIKASFLLELTLELYVIIFMKESIILQYMEERVETIMKHLYSCNFYIDWILRLLHGLSWQV